MATNVTVEADRTVGPGLLMQAWEQSISKQSTRVGNAEIGQGVLGHPNRPETDGVGGRVIARSGFSRLQHANKDYVTLALRHTGAHVLANQTKRVCGWRVPAL